MIFTQYIFFLVVSTKSIYIGLDIGSYYTKASVFEKNEQPALERIIKKHKLTPTFIAFRPPPNFNYASTSYVSPAEASDFLPAFGLTAFKFMESYPWLGMGFLPYFIDINETEGTRISNILNQNFSAARISYQDCAPLFYKFYLDAVAKDRTVHEIGIVVPAFYTIPQRSILKKIIQKTHLTKNVQIVDDVDSVAYAIINEQSELFKSKPKIYMIADVGATSIKAYAILFEHQNKKNGQSNIVATRLSYEFDTGNGGAFLTSKMVDYILHKLNINNPTDAEKWRIFDASEKIKTYLTYSNETSIYVKDIGGKRQNITMTRAELEMLSESLVNSIIKVVKKASSNLPVSDCELLGGSSLLPFMQDAFNKSGLSHIILQNNMRKDEIFAIGAGFHLQYIHKLSSIKSITMNDNSSVYTINQLGQDSKTIACHKGHKCPTKITINGTVKRLLFSYDDNQLQKGISTPTFGYSLMEQGGTIELDFKNNMFELNSARKCVLDNEYDENSRYCHEIGFSPTRIPKKYTKVFKTIAKKDKERKTIESSHNKLELLVSQCENEIEFNESVINFTNLEQRNEVKEAIKTAKELLFGGNNESLISDNFTGITNLLNSLMDPIYERISESVKLITNVQIYYQVLLSVRYMIDNDWKTNPGITEKHIAKIEKMYDKALKWFDNATEVNSNTPASESRPFKGKDFQDHMHPLYSEYARLEQIASFYTPLSPSPTPDPENSDPSPSLTPDPENSDAPVEESEQKVVTELNTKTKESFLKLFARLIDKEGNETDVEDL